jgi:hypothetical protein
VPHARSFLTDRTKYGSATPPSVDDAITDPTEPFTGVKLVIFEWKPTPGTGYRITGYEDDELVFAIQVPTEKIDRALALARVLDTDTEPLSTYPLTLEQVNEIIALPLGFSTMISGYFLEADR